MKNRIYVLLTFGLLGFLSAGLATAEENTPAANNQQLNVQADSEPSPLELYIIPWQDSRPNADDLAPEATRVLFETLDPVDPAVFERQIKYYSAPLD